MTWQKVLQEHSAVKVLLELKHLKVLLPSLSCMLISIPLFMDSFYSELNSQRNIKLNHVVLDPSIKSWDLTHLHFVVAL